MFGWLVSVAGWIVAPPPTRFVVFISFWSAAWLLIDQMCCLGGCFVAGGLAARVFDSPTSFKEVGMLTCCVFCVLGCARRLASGATIWLLQAGGQTIPSKTQQTGFSHRSAGFVCTLLLFFFINFFSWGSHARCRKTITAKLIMLSEIAWMQRYCWQVVQGWAGGAGSQSCKKRFK